MPGRRMKKRPILVRLLPLPRNGADLRWGTQGRGVARMGQGWYVGGDAERTSAPVTCGRILRAALAGPSVSLIQRKKKFGHSAPKSLLLTDLPSCKEMGLSAPTVGVGGKW